MSRTKQVNRTPYHKARISYTSTSSKTNGRGYTTSSIFVVIRFRYSVMTLSAFCCMSMMSFIPPTTPTST